MCRPGQKLDANAAGLLRIFDVKMAQCRLKLLAVWRAGGAHTKAGAWIFGGSRRGCDGGAQRSRAARNGEVHCAAALSDACTLHRPAADGGGEVEELAEDDDEHGPVRGAGWPMCAQAGLALHCKGSG